MNKQLGRFCVLATAAAAVLALGAPASANINWNHVVDPFGHQGPPLRLKKKLVTAPDLLVAHTNQPPAPPGPPGEGAQSPIERLFDLINDVSDEFTRPDFDVESDTMGSVSLAAPVEFAPIGGTFVALDANAAGGLGSTGAPSLVPAPGALGLLGGLLLAGRGRRRRI